MITPAANTLAINSVVTSVFGSVSAISIKNTSGEFYRKIPTDIEDVSTTKKLFTFYLNETEANTIIVSVSLYGNGATAALGSGTEIASQTLSLTKDNTQSLLIEWEVSVT